MFVALVANLTDHDGRGLAHFADNLFNLCALQAAQNHFVGHQAGVRIIPLTRKVGRGRFIDTRHSLTATAASNHAEAATESEDSK